MKSPHIPPKPIAPPKPQKPPVAKSGDASRSADAQTTQKTGDAQGPENPWLNPQPSRTPEGGGTGKTSKREGAKRRRTKRKKKRERKPVNVPKLGWYLFAITMLGACVAALALG
ncbi:hypothetical protein [Brevibacterium paucivorans]|uniref:hypothetical protein n=1 Tax=Brevibacterium paucivorans TaxID=170994 RepID=UPI0031D3A2EF